MHQIEFDADKASVKWTRKPDDLASALTKIDVDRNQVFERRLTQFVGLKLAATTSRFFQSYVYHIIDDHPSTSARTEALRRFEVF